VSAPDFGTGCVEAGAGAVSLGVDFSTVGGSAAGFSAGVLSGADGFAVSGVIAMASGEGLPEGFSATGDGAGDVRTSQTTTPATSTAKPSSNIRGRRAPLRVRVEVFTFAPV